MLLRNKNFAVQSVPGATPVLIGPAKAERQIETSVIQEAIDRLFQQALAPEPVIIKTEAANAVKLRQFNLPVLNSWIAQIVVAQLAWYVGLIMAVELGLGGLDICPLCESSAPPVIIFRNRMKLRKVERDEPYRKKPG